MASASQTQQFFVMKNGEDLETFFFMLDSKLTITKDSDKVLRFISVVELNALKKLRKLCLPKKVTEHSYDEIKNKVTNYLRPAAKLIWAERTKFFSMRQDRDEKLMDLSLIHI